MNISVYTSCDVSMMQCICKNLATGKFKIMHLTIQPSFCGYFLLYTQYSLSDAATPTHYVWSCDFLISLNLKICWQATYMMIWEQWQWYNGAAANFEKWVSEVHPTLVLMVECVNAMKGTILKRINLPSLPVVS
jgi:hypothetical protein